MGTNTAPSNASAPLPAARRKRRRHRPWLLRLDYVVVRTILAFFAVLPLRAAYWVAEILVMGFLRVFPMHRVRILEHLEIAFGEGTDAAWRRRVAWESVRYLSWYFVDILLAPRLLKKRRYLDAVDMTELEAVFRRDGVLERQGALIVSSHQGGPEVGSLAMSIRGWPNTAVLRQLDNPHLWDFVNRERAGIDRPMLTKHGALRQAYKEIRRPGIVGIQIDQDARGGTIFVPYFGKLACTHEGAASLALTTKAPVYLVFCIRTKRRRFAYEVRCEGPIEFDFTGDHRDDSRRITARLTRGIEEMSRRHPEQVMWAHRRWKTRPPAEGDAG